MINVAALISGKHIPSSRFRVSQHIETLKKNGIDVKEYSGYIEKKSPLPFFGKRIRVRYIFPVYFAWIILKILVRIPDIFRANRADVVWIGKELISGLVTLELFISKPFIFDVDDAIWTSGPFGRLSMSIVAKRAAVVVVGNTYLGEWFSKHAKKVEIIPTAVDCIRFYPPLSEKAQKKFVIGWTGSGQNLNYLYSIEDALILLLNKYLDIEICVISDVKPAFKNIPKLRINFIQWTPEVEVTGLHQFNVGLMPLSDSEFTRGKCSFKMLQYMAVGLPVVVSPVGMNAEILKKAHIGFSANTLTEWFNAVDWLYQNRAEGVMMGAEGRKIAASEYSQDVICSRLTKLITYVAENNIS